jgi:tetratricopeptide (TPR) repeat protein
MGEQSAVVPVLCGLWEYYVMRAELATAADLAGQLLAIARRTDDDDLNLEAQRTLGSTYFWQGNVREAYKHLERGIDATGLSTRKHANTHIYGQDTEVANLSNAACVLWLQGLPDQALQRAQQAIALAEQLKHPFSLAYAYQFSAICHQLRGDIQGTQTYTNKAIAVSSRYDFAFWKASSTMLKMWTVLQQNPDPAQLEQFEQALRDYHNTGSRLAQSYYQTLLVDIYLLLGEEEKSLAILNAALDDTENQNVRFFAAELYRLKGIVTARQQPEHIPAIEGCFMQAMETARQQHARSLELRGCISLCQYWQAQDKIIEAATLLEKTMAHFSEGYDTHDWQIANRLLQQLQKQTDVSRNSLPVA